jgi:hypothetical protein
MTFIFQINPYFINLKKFIKNYSLKKGLKDHNICSTDGLKLFEII